MIRSVNLVLAEVRDVLATANFYREMLGLQPEELSAQSASFRLGSLQLVFHVADELPDQPSGGWILNFDVEDIHSLHHKLQDGGIEKVSPLQQTAEGVSFSFHDPDGNLLRAVQADAKLEGL